MWCCWGGMALGTEMEQAHWVEENVHLALWMPNGRQFDLLGCWALRRCGLLLQAVCWAEQEGGGE